MSRFYAHKKVMVTGGGGFIGRHLVQALLNRGAQVHTVGRRERPNYLPPEIVYTQADLIDRDACRFVLTGMHYVFHLAASGDGFHANLSKQAKLLTENLLLNTTVMDSALEAGVERYLFASSTAVYPRELTDPSEEDSLAGEPHAGEQYYGWAKRMGEVQARAYFEQYRWPIAIVRPSNPYGPGDNFHPLKSHVIPAMIRRAAAGENPFVVFGSGSPERSFIHVADVADGMLLALEKHAVCDPINLATGQGTAIAELASNVLRIAGLEQTRLVFDRGKPDGPRRRVPKAEKAARVLGMTRFTSLEEGLAQTMAWYRDRVQAQRDNDELL